MKKYKIGVIGLGYVGLPLAAAFAEKYLTVGFDINNVRINELKQGIDKTLELDSSYLSSVIVNDFNKTNGLIPTDKVSDLKDCNFYIITVPTPVDKNNRPILKPLLEASELVGSFLNKEDIVVYESTVYPGATEEECIPVLERCSGMSLNIDFFVGYSPERINPGDKEHTVKKILKITSGSNNSSANEINGLYSSIIDAGTHLAPSIKVAEAAKVIENSQRDINIAFMNELSKIFRILDLDTNEVLKAASTKWNFIRFSPGLVGGHCIGVDPYYLAQKAQEVGYNPEIILSGRRINDSMGKYVASEVVKLMIKKGNPLNSVNILILGFTFKENCPDYRNTKVIDIYDELKTYKFSLDIYDPLIEKDKLLEEYNVNCVDEIKGTYNAIILAVPHEEFKILNLKSFLKSNGVIFDVKGILEKEHSDGRL